MLGRCLEALMTHERAELIQQICAPYLIHVEAAPSGDTAQLLCEGWELAHVIRLQIGQRRAPIRTSSKREHFPHLCRRKPASNARAREPPVL